MSVGFRIELRFAGSVLEDLSKFKDQEIGFEARSKMFSGGLHDRKTCTKERWMCAYTSLAKTARSFCRLRASEKS